MSVPVMLAAYVAGRVDCTKWEPPAIVVPIRPPNKRIMAPAAPRERKTYMFEGTCCICSRPFSRLIPSDADEPKTCSVNCAARLRWAQNGVHAFNPAKRNRTFGAGRYPSRANQPKSPAASRGGKE